jgi:hypothetical protein
MAQDALSMAAAAQHSGIGGANIAALNSVAYVVILGQQHGIIEAESEFRHHHFPLA